MVVKQDNLTHHLQKARAQKMEALGRLAHGIIHDLDRILSSIEGQATFLARNLGPLEAKREGAYTILHAAGQAQTLLSRIRLFSRDIPHTDDLFNMQDMVRSTLTLIRGSAPRAITVEEDISEEKKPLMVKGCASQMGQLALNICLNARDSMRTQEGKLSIGLYTVRAEAVWSKNALLPTLPQPDDLYPICIQEPVANRICLSLGNLTKGQKYAHFCVSDTGLGIGREDMEHIFEPFFTTKSLEEGTGLGLSVVHGVLTAHQGALTIDSTLERGTRFDVYIPLVAPI